MRNAVCNYAILLILLSLAFPIGQVHSAEKAPEPTIPQHIEQLLAQEGPSSWAPDINRPMLREFYTPRQYQPIWDATWGMSENAALFRDALIDSHLEGLDPSEYHIDGIRYLWKSNRIINRARLELLLTDAFLRYSIEVRAGYQYPRAVDPRWYVDPPKVDPITLLRQAIDERNLPKLLRELPPPHPQYQLLKRALANYRQLQSQTPTWPTVPGRNTLRLGDRDPAIIPLRQRLISEGFLANTPPTYADLLDTDVEQAVRDFQHQYGHEVDGMVGRITRRSLNISLDDRIKQIQQNMERWRWLPRDLGQRYVMVNMAGYQLELVENGTPSLEMRVIIGKTYRGTPAFANQIEYLDINPTWHVPASIAKQDLLPKIQKDGQFLTTNRMRVFDSWKKDATEIDPLQVDWTTLNEDNFPYYLVQDPGPNNSLGNIKFMFPNSWSIYLHDTPSRELFNKEVRTFSSGCIRIERPITLAYKLLNDEGWDQRKIRDTIRDGKTQRITLKKTVPIYLLYWTAWVDEHGRVQFRDDIYDRNENIATGPVEILPNS
ncbi:MAG: L,D-transpeptidase family protein [Gammaproteobacteria bacterium]|nr:L,D-transpeptidase family protein [Gammaproteobacteria bacterium]